MKKTELRQIIREEIQYLTELEMYYDGEGKLKKLQQIDDIDSAIQYYNTLVNDAKNKYQQSKDHLDRRELWDYQDSLKKLKMYKKKQK